MGEESGKILDFVELGSNCLCNFVTNLYQILKQTQEKLSFFSVAFIQQKCSCAFHGVLMLFRFSWF